MNRYAAIALTIASMFLIVMAVLVNSPALFYMATAIIATLGASRLQAWLAVRGLRFERVTSPAVRVGELVTVEIIVWSDRKLKRPLVTVLDQLPRELVVADRTWSLPIAPSFDQPIRTRYCFRPMRRGKYKWSTLTAFGTDALGLATLENEYETEPIELIVYPSPLPVSADIHPTIGWGASDLDSGKMQGVGLEPRGVREFVAGDPLRYIHWRSSARRGTLMVKEFETGSGVHIHFLLQRTLGTDVGTIETSSFEAMCGHALYLASNYAKKGASIQFTGIESREASLGHSEARERDFREVLTDIQPNRMQSLSEELSAVRSDFRPGDTLVLLIAVADEQLPHVISSLNEVKTTALVYDPNEYRDPKRNAPYLPSATDPEYISHLESCGVEVIVMPRVEKLG